MIHLLEVKIHVCVDDEQLYDSDTDPLLPDKQLMYHLNIANKWYQSNGMLVNPAKHQAMIRGYTDHVFSFSVQKSIE